jgi:hypothetical protein
VARAAKKAATVVRRVAVAAGKAVYKASGIQSAVSCVTDPSVASCVQAAVAGLALTIATGGAGAVVDVGLDAAADAATDVAVDATEDAAEDAAEDAGADAAEDAEKAANSGSNKLGLQLGIGAANGAASNAISGYEQGQWGWKLLELTGVGAVTGAVSAIPVGGGLFGATALGGAIGFANGARGQMVSRQSVSLHNVNWGWATVDAGLGAGANAGGYGVAQSAGNNATLGNVLAGQAGMWGAAICGGLDASRNWNC